jgi:hypothetical protein
MHPLSRKGVRRRTAEPCRRPKRPRRLNLLFSSRPLRHRLANFRRSPRRPTTDDAAAVGGGLWLSYLFVLFYLAVAAGAVTHADLFFENPVKLPFLNIELPLLAFFFLAPILFLIVHAYTLVHLVMLTDKAKRYHQALYDQIGDDKNLPKDELERRRAIRDGLERQLPSNIFVQFLAGPESVRASALGFALRAIAWITLVVAPVLLLLLMQVQFLPFHSSFVTWTQRLALAADLGIIWWLWRKILSGRLVERRRSMDGCTPARSPPRRRLVCPEPLSLVSIRAKNLPVTAALAAKSSLRRFSNGLSAGPLGVTLVG